MQKTTRSAVDCNDARDRNYSTRDTDGCSCRRDDDEDDVDDKRMENSRQTDWLSSSLRWKGRVVCVDDAA